MIPLRTDRSEHGSRAEPVEIWNARKFIREHLDEELSLTRVARSVNETANYFSEKFKKVTGINFVRHVACARIEKACELLKNGDLPVSEIAFAVGFQSLSQFNRTFKKLTGKSPTELRAKLAEANGVTKSNNRTTDFGEIIFRKNA